MTPSRIKLSQSFRQLQELFSEIQSDVGNGNQGFQEAANFGLFDIKEDIQENNSESSEIDSNCSPHNNKGSIAV